MNLAHPLKLPIGGFDVPGATKPATPARCRNSIARSPVQSACSWQPAAKKTIQLSNARGPNGGRFDWWLLGAEPDIGKSLHQHRRTSRMLAR